MPIWMNNSKWSISTELPVVSTASNILEGTALVWAQENGMNKVQAATGAANEVFAGVALNYVQVPTYGQWVDYITIPSSSPYTATLSQTPINPTTAVGVITAAGVKYTYNAGVGSTQYSISGTTITFNSANAGVSVSVFYQYTLTVSQAQYLFGSNYAYVGSVSAQQVLSTAGVIKSAQVLFTDQYDPSVNWVTANIGYPAGASQITLASGGIFTLGGSGAVVNGTVVQIPNSGNNPNTAQIYPNWPSAPSAYLGIAFTAA